MKILLIAGSIAGEERYGQFEEMGSYLPPYGLLCIAAVLEQNGFEVKILDTEKVEMTFEQLSQVITEYSPDLIGMTVYSIGSKQVIATAEAIKKKFKIPIVAGGPHAMIYPDDLAQYQCFDYLVTGEGEYTMLELAQTLESKGDLRKVPGIIFGKNGQIVRTPDRPYIDNLDELPFPAFHLLEGRNDYAPSALIYKKKPLFALITSRGCPYRCIFCRSIWSRHWRANSAKYVVDMVEYVINNFGVKEITFLEDVFTLNKKRVLEICSLIKKRQLKFSWSCSAVVRTLDKELMKVMKDSGCWMISCGIESGNDEVLKFIRKPLTTDMVRRAISDMDEVGIRPRGYFMIGHLVDTKETIRQTIDFAKSLPFYSVNFNIMHLSPGSEAREIAHKYGKVNMDLSLCSGYCGKGLSFVAHGLTAEWLYDTQKRAFREFFLRPIQIWRLLKTISGIEDVKRYWVSFKAFVKLYLIHALVRRPSNR